MKSIFNKIISQSWEIVGGRISIFYYKNEWGGDKIYCLPTAVWTELTACAYVWVKREPL